MRGHQAFWGWTASDVLHGRPGTSLGKLEGERRGVLVLSLCLPHVLVLSLCLPHVLVLSLCLPHPACDRMVRGRRTF